MSFYLLNKINHLPKICQKTNAMMVYYGKCTALPIKKKRLVGKQKPKTKSKSIFNRFAKKSEC